MVTRILCQLLQAQAMSDKPMMATSPTPDAVAQLTAVKARTQQSTMLVSRVSNWLHG